MLVIKAQIDQKDYSRWINALNRLEKTAIREADRLPWRQAVGYVNFVRRRISSGAITTAPYEPEYERRKKIMAGHLKPWILTGALLESLTVEKDEEGYFGGIPSGAESVRWSWESTTGPSGIRPIAKYARALEYKHKGQRHRRPVMQPALHDYTPAAMREVKKTKGFFRMAWR